MGAGDFWNNQEHAQSVVLQVKALKNWVDPFETLVARVTSARELAELLDAEPDAGMDADLDAEIERETGSSVADIFATEGEAAFRAREAAALTDASTHDPAVVACGGGVVLEPANRITLRNTGVAVFLDVPLEQLASVNEDSTS